MRDRQMDGQKKKETKIQLQSRRKENICRKDDIQTLVEVILRHPQNES